MRPVAAGTATGRGWRKFGGWLGASAALAGGRAHPGCVRWADLRQSPVKFLQWGKAARAVAVWATAFLFLLRHDFSPPIHSRACAAYFGERSMPRNFRPSEIAARPVVPLPANGSNTASPSLLAARITRRRSLSGI